MISKKRSNVELTKIHYYDRNCVPSISLGLFEKGTGKGFEKSSLEQGVEKKKIIRKNVFGRKWVLKINEPAGNGANDKGETAKSDNKFWKMFFYVIVFCCIIVAICFGIFFTFESRIFKNQHTNGYNKNNNSNNTEAQLSKETDASDEDKLKSEMTTTTTSTTKAYDRILCRCNKTEEICLKILETDRPRCVKILNKSDPTGCGGLCQINTQYCKPLDPIHGVYQCRESRAILKCPSDTFNCQNRCIAKSERCDGIFHCSDHSDEINCVCDLKTHFQCGNTTSCIENKRRCDGRVDCWDKSDENNCHRCDRDEAPCQNGQCILKQHFCDGFVHCTDKSDEPYGCQL